MTILDKKLYSPAVVRGLQQRHGFSATKSLGQNFLIDKNIIGKIIESAAIGPNDLLVEIGPGIGTLTREAAQRAKKVLAIEIDRHLIPVLEETLDDLPNVRVIHQDVLKTDLRRLVEDESQGCSGVKIMGNLPYYITTPIIMKVLEERVSTDSLTIMLQKEVAERIRAEASTKEYGAITVAVRYYAETSFVAAVPRDVFTPSPNVDSAVIRLDIRREKPVDLLSEEIFFAVVKAGFGQRRKTLQNALQSAFSKETAVAALQASGIDPIRRAETLSVQEFANLSNAIAASQPRI